MKLNLKYLLIPIFFISNTILSTNISLKLTKRQLCDLELILNDGFAPLTGFMNRGDYKNVLNNVRLSDGTVWPMPIMLDIDEATARQCSNDTAINLCDSEGTVLGVLTVSDIWQPDKHYEALKVFKTTDTAHPGVDYLFNKTKAYYVGGSIEKISPPAHYDFTDIRRTPAELKQHFQDHNIKQVVAFQTRNPMHRAHKEITSRAAQAIEGHLLIHPVVGMTKPGDIDYVTRIRCYKKLLNYYSEGSVTLSLLPIAMRMAGPREALWHAIIRKNYGCTHFIVGRDHAGPGNDKNGNPFYGPYDSQEMVKMYADEIGITMVPFKMVAYVKDLDAYLPANEVPEGSAVLKISGTKLRKMLKSGEKIPEWLSYPEIVTELRKTYKSKSKQGFTIFLTGLCASGKSTTAKAVAAKLTELQDRPLTILDGDIVRQNLSKGLGFSKQDRSTNVRRVGFVAKEITKHGGIAICALVSPYETDRNYNRSQIESHGGYIEIHVSTPLEVCEQRDPKGLYRKARAGIIKQFTGIDDPYEIPQRVELSINTTDVSVEEIVETIVSYLKSEFYI